MNEESSYKFELEKKRNAAISWLKASDDRITKAVEEKLSTARKNEQARARDMKKDHDDFTAKFSEFLFRLETIYRSTREKKDPEISRRAVYLYRTAAEAAAAAEGKWREAVKNKEFVKDEKGYLEWEKEAERLNDLVKEARADADLLFVNGQIYAAMQDINRAWRRVEETKKSAPSVAINVLTELNARVDLFLAVFETAYKENRYKAATPFKDIVDPFYKTKEKVAEELEALWYDAVKNKTNVDRSQAQDVVGNVEKKFKEKYWPLIEQDAFIKDRKIDPDLAKQPLKMGAIFGAYFRQHLGVMVLKNDYPALYDVLRDQKLDGDDAFEVMAGVLGRTLPRLYAALDKKLLTQKERSDLERLVFDIVRFVQNVIIDSGPFRPGMSSMADILSGLGWNNSSLSMMTVLLAEDLGIRQVSMVDLKSDQFDLDQWKLVYPVMDMVYHSVNLVRVGNESFILDQGRGAEPSELMVIGERNEIFAADREQLTFDLRLSGLDATRLKKHFEVVRKAKEMERTIDEELTKESFLAQPDLYVLKNKKLRGELERFLKDNPEIRWSESWETHFNEVLYTKLQEDRWAEKNKGLQVMKDREQVIQDLKGFLKQAGIMQEAAYRRKSPQDLKRAAHRYRVAAQAAAVAALESRKGIQNESSYAVWEETMNIFDETINNVQEMAEKLDLWARIYAARDEIGDKFEDADNARKNADFKKADNILKELDARVDLFISVFETASRKIPLKDVLEPFHVAKQAIAQEQENVWDEMLDNYSISKRKSTVDHSQALDPLGGIDLNPSRFNIKVQGNTELLFAEVPAADAVRIEGLEPQILSIIPGEGFIKRLIR
jgi:hypothetical protein